MGWTILLLLGATVFNGPQSKPACNRANQSRFWPEEANYDSGLARQLTQRGELEMCTLVVWKYKWRLTSVNVKTMKHAGDSAHRLPPTTK